MVEAVKSPRCSSVITYDEKFEPEDFIVTVTKLLHGQVFGLQKYFPWGVTLYNMEIAGYEEKVKAIDVLNAYAELAGARGPVRDRMALVAEELMINAMYHAPTDEKGKPLYQHLPRKEMSGKIVRARVKVACASNGQLFAVAVRDAYGSLDKETVVKFLSKGTQKSLTPEQKESGAGLGLVTALKNANKLVFNLAPGMGTEVIALFDLDLLAKGRPGVRAVHIFTERRKLAAPAPREGAPRLAAAVDGAAHRRRAGDRAHRLRRRRCRAQAAGAAAGRRQSRGHRRRRRIARRAGAHRLVRREAEGRAQGLELLLTSSPSPAKQVARADAGPPC